MIPAIANGHSTGESTFKTRPSPQTNAHRIATSSAIENAVSEAQTIRACFSVGGGKLIPERGQSPSAAGVRESCAGRFEAQSEPRGRCGQGPPAVLFSLSPQRGEGRGEG